ncbi:hypothetical protein CH267_00300 [Rhodococcus sp. 06-621-2]|nr:hypothetical protein [Rhodococcus sp. 06-621-2]OZC62832.1 hypothetical protein CH267_00300 [Rhodococcus sp. 06-621-2]
MVFLRSLRGGTDPQHASFIGAAADDSDPFAVTVDEILAGPVIITAAGTLDSVAAPVFGECVTEAVVSGRGMVVDLLHIYSIDRAGSAIVQAASTRVASAAANFVVACTLSLQRQLTDAGVAVASRRTLAEALKSALQHSDLQHSDLSHSALTHSVRRAPVRAQSTGSSSPLDPRDALHGTYL